MMQFFRSFGKSKDACAPAGVVGRDLEVARLPCARSQRSAATPTVRLVLDGRARQLLRVLQLRRRVLLRLRLLPHRSSSDGRKHEASHCALS
eukprot:SAG11_NODE_628_length_8077_cov_4.820632_9_plen_92_part_00